MIFWPTLSWDCLVRAGFGDNASPSRSSLHKCDGVLCTSQGVPPTEQTTNQPPRQNAWEAPSSSRRWAFWRVILCKLCGQMGKKWTLLKPWRPGFNSPYHHPQKTNNALENLPLEVDFKMLKSTWIEMSADGWFFTIACCRIVHQFAHVMAKEICPYRRSFLVSSSSVLEAL